MDFFEAVRRRRSVRRYTADPVPESALRAMLEAARLAPSATNEQPWRFLVIRNPETRASLQAMVDALMDAHIEMAETEERKRRIGAMRFYANYFGAAPVVIAVLAHPWPAARPEVWDAQPFRSGLQSVAAATAHLVLAATALGYGSCWATAPLDFAAEELAALLGVEPPWSLVALVTVGRAEHTPQPAPRKPLEEVAIFLD